MKRATVLIFLILTVLNNAKTLQAQENSTVSKGTPVVGFIRQVVYDYSRSTRERIDYRLNDIDSKESNRLPITLHIWYPAVRKKYRPIDRLRYVDFQLMQDYDIDTLPTSKKDSLRKVYFNWVDSIHVQKVANSITTNTFYKATAIKGRYPLILSISTNPGMNEYLASLGYIVVRIQYAYSDRTASVVNKDRELNEDIATVHFVKNYMANNFATADPNRTALIGSSYYGSIMQLVQMSSAGYDALVSLDGVEAWTNSKDRMIRNDYFLPEMALAPILRIHNQNAPNVDWDYFYKKASNCDQWVLSFDKITHGNTTNADLSIEIEKLTTGRANTKLKAKQILMWRSIGHFLNRYIKNDPKGAEFLTNLLSEKHEETTVTFKPKATVKTPSIQEMKLLFERNGLSGLQNIRTQMKDSAHLISVLILYNLSQLYRFTSPSRQIELMSFAMKLHPQSAFAKYIVALYHSQGGRFEQAIALAKEVLQIIDSGVLNDLNARQSDQVKIWLVDWEERLKHAKPPSNY